MKKQTIIWEENSTPPTDYIWVKPDDKPYAYNEETRKWEETTLPGGGGNEFPYEYQAISFTVDVKAEDWTVNAGEAYCTITLEVPIPLQHTNMIWGILNNSTPQDVSSRAFILPIAELNDGLITINLNNNAITSIYVSGYYNVTFTPPENLKLEFKNLIFI